MREAYDDETYRRLTEVKATFDPDNVFHHNKNIRPDESNRSRVRFIPHCDIMVGRRSGR